MFKQYRRLVGYVVLASLTLQPFSVLAGFDFKQNIPKSAAKGVATKKVSYDFKTSKEINSPRIKDLALFKEVSAHRLSRSNQLLSLMINRQEIAPEEYAKHFPGSELKDKRAWIKLLDMLQLINEPTKKSIASSIGRTITQAGSISLVNFIAQENHDWVATKKRQQFIKFLVENPDQLKLIQERLTTIKEYEPVLLKELFRKEDSESRGTLLLALGVLCWSGANWLAYKLERGEDHVLGRENAWHSGLKLIGLLNATAALAVSASKAIAKNDKFDGPLQNALNTALALLSGFLMVEGTGLMIKPGDTIYATIWPILKALKSSYVQNGLKPKLEAWKQQSLQEANDAMTNYPKNDSHTYWYWAKKTIFPIGPTIAATKLLDIVGTNENPQIRAALNTSLVDDPAVSFYKNPGWWSSRIGAGAFFVGAMLGFYLSDKHLHNKGLFARAQGMAQVIKCSDDLYKLLFAQPISTAYESLFAEFSPEYKSLMEKSASSTVHADARYTPFSLFTLNQSRINQILALTKTTFEETSKLTQFYGEIDAYAAMAQLILDHQATKNNQDEDIRCCFAEMDEESTDAYACVAEMWHPMIPTDRVRTNSIKLGGSPETPRNGIITGPNAAGKSVSMKALLINIIFAQAFGVGFAKSLKFTPFKKIIAQFGSADDTANDQSKFMYEATSVVDLLKQLKDLSPEDKALVFTDELFSGTEVTPAILLSVELCSRVSVLKNVCYILATHYKDLTQLKELTSNAFENYKVTATVDENSRISYPFKLQHGIGDTNVAFDIFLDQMRKQGVNDPELESIIKNARARQHAISV